MTKPKDLKRKPKTGPAERAVDHLTNNGESFEDPATGLSIDPDLVIDPELLSGPVADIANEAIIPGEPVPPSPDHSAELITADVDITLPIYRGILDHKRTGFTSGRIDCDLYGEFAEGFRRLVVGLRNAHATYQMNGQVRHVDNGNDAIRYLVGQINQSIKEDK